MGRIWLRAYGRNYIVFGKSDNTAPVEASAVVSGSGGFVINGTTDEPGDYEDSFINAAGDVNGDGLADVIIGLDDDIAPAGERVVALTLFLVQHQQRQFS